jgi:hypothetical protein
MLNPKLIKIQRNELFLCHGAVFESLPVSIVKSGSRINRKSKNQLKKERLFFRNYNRMSECA